MDTSIPQPIQIQQIPPSFARQWEYKPSNHIYAIKVLCEIKAIVHEYCVWLGKAKEAKENASLIFVPALSLEWPKHWSTFY